MKFLVLKKKTILWKKLTDLYKRGEADVPLFETKTKSQQRNSTKKKSYRSEILHGSCLIGVQYGTVKKRRRNRRKPPRKGNKNYGRKRRFSAVAPPFLHSSILYPYKATAMQNLRPVTLFLVEFLC